MPRKMVRADKRKLYFNTKTYLCKLYIYYLIVYYLMLTSKLESVASDIKNFTDSFIMRLPGDDSSLRCEIDSQDSQNFLCLSLSLQL